ncbi:replicative DNA helicase [Lyngbya aestuarii]|uniref:replicative DNA helicase n=1 Tax=Lyngbya aestuarii TaxID=118322 RepID=UPI00403E2BA5
MAQELDFSAFSYSLPPQNVDAEESILGGIMLDSEAIARIVDILPPEAFYIDAHKEIYKAALVLYSQGQPTDLMSVTTWLYDRELLERIGGQSKLAQLVDRTVSAVNIDRYAKLVIDKYQRRQLIRAGNEIVQLGYETSTDLEIVLDKAEQTVFGLSQSSPKNTLTPISETLIQTFHEIQTRDPDVALPGIASDFYDLDAMTGGFQRSDLVIVAGRPSMGKTSFALGIARNISENLPVAIFSLEMSKEQLVQRLLASEAGIESNYLRAGRISQNQWGPLSHALGTLSELPIFIDDAANPTVMQMRSQLRRLQAEQAGKLGLILIDYLQLMEGSGSENRVQELSRITRSLKGLARELNVPIIALSQLSRGVEARNNKRPMMSDLRESGCLSGDSLVTLADSCTKVPIRELVGKSCFAVWALNTATMKLERAVASNAFCTGVKPVFRLETALGRTIRATANHQFLTLHGWQRLDHLREGSRLAIPCCLPSSSQEQTIDANSASSTTLARLIELSDAINNNNNQFLAQTPGCLELISASSSREVIRSSQLTASSSQLIDSNKINRQADGDIYWDSITSIEADGTAEVYDLTVPSLHNFIANSIVLHNSIEQDADLVMMLYRDSYYNPDSPDRDVAEVIIAKHRNGPTGTVKLLFKPELTQFLNLAHQ